MILDLHFNSGGNPVSLYTIAAVAPQMNAYYQLFITNPGLTRQYQYLIVGVQTFQGITYETAPVATTIDTFTPGSGIQYEVIAVRIGPIIPWRVYRRVNGTTDPFRLLADLPANVSNYQDTSNDPLTGRPVYVNNGGLTPLVNQIGVSNGIGVSGYGSSLVNGLSQYIPLSPSVRSAILTATITINTAYTALAPMVLALYLYGAVGDDSFIPLSTGPASLTQLPPVQYQSPMSYSFPVTKWQPIPDNVTHVIPVVVPLTPNPGLVTTPLTPTLAFTITGVTIIAYL